MAPAPRILLAPTWATARTVTADVTIEAEYGSNVAIGRVATAAHHQRSGPWSGSAPAPCNDRRLSSLDPTEVGVILVSHLDLDTIGGCLRAMGVADMFRPEFDAFWALAEAVDVAGRHRLPELGGAPLDVDRLLAFAAYTTTVIAARPRPPAHEIADVTEVVVAAGAFLRKILPDAEEARALARREDAEQRALDAASFVRQNGPVVVRHVPRRGLFVNHLYGAGKVVASWSAESGALTLSAAEPGVLDCRAVVQGLWGPQAGGHEGIAGSPRGVVYGVEDLDRLVAAALAALAVFEEARTECAERGPCEGDEARSTELTGPFARRERAEAPDRGATLSSRGTRQRATGAISRRLPGDD